MKLARDIHHVSAHCWKGFQGQRSKVKVIPDQLTYNGGGIHFDGVAYVEAHLLYYQVYFFCFSVFLKIF